MSHVHEGPLATYNSLLDPHLAGYFSNTHIRKHLRKSKLITRKGQVITESKYRLLNARHNHRKQVREMLAQAIVHKTLDMERQRQAEVRKRLDRISKIEMVKKVRAERKFGYEDTIMDLLRPPSEIRRRRRNSGKSTDSLPQLTGSTRSSVSYRRDTRSAQERRRDDIDSRGHAYIRGESRRKSTSRSRSYSRDRSRSKSSDRKDRRRGSASSISSFDTESSESHRDGHHVTPHRDRSREKESRTRSKSPYEDSDAQPPMAWKPHPPAKKPPPNTPRDEHGRPIKSQKHVRGRVILHRQEPAFKHEKDVQTFCEVTLKYLGGTYSHEMQQQIIVEQQHCGGNTLTVFKEYVKPKSNFTFVSKRHRGYPFGLTIYIEGHQDASVSTCCEYKHRKGVLLGSKSSHFLFVSVKGAQPCYKCQVEAELSEKAKKDKEKREKRKQDKEEQEKKDEEKDYDEDFDEASDAEKDDEYADDFDDGQSNGSPRSPVQSSRRSKSRSPDRSDDEEKTAREVKSYEDELEVKSQRSDLKSSSSSKRSSKGHKKSGSGSSQQSVTVPVHDSDDEYSDKDSVKSPRSDRSKSSVKSDRSIKSPLSDRSAKSDHSKSDRSIKSPQSDRSAKSDHSKSDQSIKSPRSDRSDRSKKSDRSGKSSRSDRSKKSSVSSVHTERSEQRELAAVPVLEMKPVQRQSLEMKPVQIPELEMCSAPERELQHVVESDGSEKSYRSARSDSSRGSRGSAKSNESKKSAKSTSSSASSSTVKSHKSAASDNTVKSAEDKQVNVAVSASVSQDKPKSIEDNPFYAISTSLAMNCNRARDSDDITVNAKSGSFSEFMEVLKVDRDLSRLSLNGCSLTDSEMSQVAAALIKSGCPLLLLDVGNNSFGLRGGMEVAVIAKHKNDTMLELNMSGTKVTRMALEEVVSSLIANSVNLKKLELDYCVEDGEKFDSGNQSSVQNWVNISKGSKLQSLSVSHLSCEMVGQMCTGINNSGKQMSYLSFEHIDGINDIDTGYSPLKLNSEAKITTLSLANNSLDDNTMEKILDYWRANKADINTVKLVPGNEGLSDSCLKKTRDWCLGIEADQPASQTKEETESESDDVTSSSESSAAEETKQESVAAQSQSPITVVGKPPLPPHKSPSRQNSSVSSASGQSSATEEQNSKAESTSGESEDSVAAVEKEYKALAAQPTGDEAKTAAVTSGVSATATKPEKEDESGEEESETETETETETEKDTAKQPKVTLATSSDEATTPRGH